MYVAMSEALDAADADSGAAVVLIHGQADLFSAGNDLGDFLEAGSRQESAAPRFLRTIASVRKPIVAAVGGPAIGIGTTLLLHCDMVIAADDARFQLPFVSLGLCPEAGSSLLLPQMAGHRLASELMLLGDVFDSAVAQRAGIVSRVVPAPELLTHARAVAARLAAQPADALATTKELLKRPAGRSVLQAIEAELPQFERLLASPTARSIFQSFLDKRSR